jgi:hypothetical protein
MSALGGAATAGVLPAAGLVGFDGRSSSLPLLSTDLLREWAETLLCLQVKDQADSKYYGGIYCAADKAVHGRSGDTIYPFLHLAHKQKDSRFLDAAVLLYRWMETHVSQADGSWLNEPVTGSWKGTTVFAATSLAEAIKYHGSVLDNKLKDQMLDRLRRAGEFVYQNIDYKYGNINYPISAAYALSLLGTVLDNAKFRSRGKELAQEALQYFTKKDGLLYGEGDMVYEPSAKGCLAVDLGYNVEESLPALVQYGLLNGDATLLETVTHAMQKHLEFMLPDGGWDNSWGTRNFKWTYWGSRTSDGCQTAYALLADRDPRFYRAALLNTQLMKQCTHDGLLTGGPHYHAHSISTCVHHTFSHAKALTVILDHGIPVLKNNITTPLLPRETASGYRFFEDIQTWLIAKGAFRATVTGYDKEYKKTRNGHASGGALTMLWHAKAGPLVAAGMNAYQLYEPGNMQPDTDPFSMPLTPRIELKQEGKVYMNISDLSAVVSVEEESGSITVSSVSKLVDKDQQDPSTGAITCHTWYTFTDHKVIFAFRVEKPNTGIAILFPVISAAAEKINFVSDKIVHINKKNCRVKVSSDTLLHQAPTSTGRIFNYVPGFEAIPFMVSNNKATIEIEIG